jgi:hypothetical protein
VLKQIHQLQAHESIGFHDQTHGDEEERLRATYLSNDTIEIMNFSWTIGQQPAHSHPDRIHVVTCTARGLVRQNEKRAWGLLRTSLSRINIESWLHIFSGSTLIYDTREDY